MQRDDSNQEVDDPRADVRARILQQQTGPDTGGGGTPPPTPDPVYSDPAMQRDANIQTQANAANDSGSGPGGVTPWSEQNPWDTGSDPYPAAPAQPQRQGITDPTVRAASPSAGAGAIPTNPDGSQVGSGIQWDPRTGAPSSSPPGYHWDPNLAMFQPDAAPSPTAAPTSTRPSGGSLTDPNFAQQFVAWAGNQPGVNPSVKNDPNYWIGRFTSGAFGNDQNYALQRMMQAEGPPEGAGAPAPTRSAGSSVAAPQSFNYTPATANAPQGAWNSDFIQQIRQILMQRLSANSQPLDPNDPNITMPLTAARDEATRQSDKERTDLAENLYAQGGLNTDAIAQKIQQSGEKNASSLSGLRATLITRELSARRDELKSLLQMAVQSGDAESAAAIQSQIAALNAQVQREGLGLDAQKYAAYLNTIGAEQVMN